MKTIEYFMNIHIKAVALKQFLLENPDHPRSEELEQLLCKLLCILKEARLDWNGFEKVKALVSEIKDNDDENLDSVHENLQAVLLVEDEVEGDVNEVKILEVRVDNEKGVKMKEPKDIVELNNLIVKSGYDTVVRIDEITKAPIH